jgi:hypothetical protein
VKARTVKVGRRPIGTVVDITPEDYAKQATSATRQWCIAVEEEAPATPEPEEHAQEESGEVRTATADEPEHATAPRKKATRRKRKG